MSDDDKPARASDDAALLAEARRFLELRVRAEGDNREQARIDLRFLSGEHWDPQVAAARKLDGRPTLTINKLPAFLNQVTNDQRQNKPSIKVHAVDNDADPETAEIVQGLIRHIEYASNADVCYDTAVNSAAACSMGYWRLVTDYVSEDSFDQEIRFDRIRNPFTVFLGEHKEPDASDMRRAIIVVDMDRDAFRAEYPKADPVSIEWVKAAPGWVTDTQVRVALYYRVECRPRMLARLADGSVMWASEVPEGVEPERTRMSEERTVWCYKLSAAEVLERTEVPCYWIPIFPVYGSEIDVDGQVIRASLIRFARDPSYMYDVWMSAATEEVALRTKTPYIGAEGQFEGFEGQWKQANMRSFAYLQYKPKTVAGQLAPPPQRQPMADIPAGTLAMAMHASDNIKATTGIFDASLGARGNETSGKAIIARQREGDTASFHYTDNLARSIRQCARCILWMIPRVYDTERVVRILGDDEKPQPVTINQPVAINQPAEDETAGIMRVLNDLTVGTYDVTVTMGPSYTTMRQEAADAMVQMGQAWPKLMDIAGDKVVRAMDWPGADDIAERIARTIPPEIRGTEEGEEGDGQVQVPPQVQAAMTQLQRYAEALEQQLADAESGIAKAQIDAAAKVQAAEIAAEGRKDVEELKGAVQLLVAQIGEQQQRAQEQAAAAQQAAAAPAQVQRAARAVDVASPGDRVQAPDLGMYAVLQTVLAQSDAISRGIDQLARMSGPKRIVLDAEGNPIGVEPVDMQPAAMPDEPTDPMIEG